MKLFLMLDYDGTLTPITRHPARAQLSAHRRKMLLGLANHPDIKLAIISGRELAVVKKMAQIKPCVYVGNHGFEILVNGRHWVYPSAKKFKPLLKKILLELQQKITHRGVLIEDKGLTLSVHYRVLAKQKLSGFINQFRQCLNPWRGQIKVTQGKKVFEIRPPFDWDKGKAVRWLINKLHLNFAKLIYIGDDATDEDAFREVNRYSQALTFRVGKSGKTCARYRLTNLVAVYKLLSQVADN